MHAGARNSLAPKGYSRVPGLIRALPAPALMIKSAWTADLNAGDPRKSGGTSRKLRFDRLLR